VEKNTRNKLSLWIALLLISVVLTVEICSVIDALGNGEVLSFGNVVGASESFTSAYVLWKSVYVLLLFVATGMLIACGVVSMLSPRGQSERIDGVYPNAFFIQEEDALVKN
jgi:hypothetical protein